jgi:hypothetical protein
MEAQRSTFLKTIVFGNAACYKSFKIKTGPIRCVIPEPYGSFSSVIIHYANCGLKLLWGFRVMVVKNARILVSGSEHVLIPGLGKSHLR